MTRRTREEFDSQYLGKAVHCDTKEKAKEFLALADSVGYKWSSDESLIEKNMWEHFEKETCYRITNDGILIANFDYVKRENYQIIEYQPSLKFKVGDKVRIKEAPYIVNGKVGVIEDVNSSSPTPYYVKIDGDNKWLWHLTENELEKANEPTHKEETIDDIIEEIKVKWSEINILLNQLEKKRGKKDERSNHI